LNDAVISKGGIAIIIHLGVQFDGIQALESGGDGVIIATPTGSTAYSLSAGGPIVEPEAHSILITPICAHDMMSRCVVASERRTVTVELTLGSPKKLNHSEIICTKSTPTPAGPISIPTISKDITCGILNLRSKNGTNPISPVKARNKIKNAESFITVHSFLVGLWLI
jgi:NAD kinase